MQKAVEEQGKDEQKQDDAGSDGEREPAKQFLHALRIAGRFADHRRGQVLDRRQLRYQRFGLSDRDADKLGFQGFAPPAVDAIDLIWTGSQIDVGDG